MGATSLVKRAISAKPVAAALRGLNRSALLPDEARHLLYTRVTRRIDWDPTGVFTWEVPGGRTLRIHRDGTIRELDLTGRYELDSLPLFAQCARTADAVLDIGSAEGIYAMVAAAASPTAAVVAFEPSPGQHRRLRANLALNADWMGDRVQASTVALANEVGTASFYDVPGNSSLNPDFRPHAPVVEVEVARGDDVVAELLPGRRVDLMKIDTESTEPDVLLGLASTIERDQPAIVCEVLAGRTEAALQEILDGWGYRTWWLGPDGPRGPEPIVGDPTYRHANWLFLPEGRTPATS
jgi:FkbM family methyltransferase